MMHRNNETMIGARVYRPKPAIRPPVRFTNGVDHAEFSVPVVLTGQGDFQQTYTPPFELSDPLSNYDGQSVGVGVVLVLAVFFAAVVAVAIMVTFTK